MGTLIFVFPTTGHQVSTGVEVDRSSYKSLPRTKTTIFCPRCRKSHLLSASGLGTTMTPRDVGHPLVCPCRSKLTPNMVRGAFGFGGRVWYGGQKLGGGRNEKPPFAINLKPGPFVTSRTNTMASRRKSKPSVKAKERAEPHFGSRKRDGPRKPRKSQARKSPTVPRYAQTPPVRVVLRG